MYSIALKLGPLTLHWYGVLVALGFLLGLWNASRPRPGWAIPGEKIADLGRGSSLAPWLGARTLYVISYWREQFAGQPLREFS